MEVMMSLFTNLFKSKGVQPHCVINAILCAWTWGTFKGVEVRIAVSQISPGLDHSQAQALINGKWTPLTELWKRDHLEVVPYKSHYPDIEPYRYLTLKDWIEEQIGYATK
jgi:hypothetical protein